MYKISKLLLKAFIGPFVVTFFIAILVLEMQFLWLYIDDMMGKGIDIFIILKLLVYNSAWLVNLALPLALLMSSIMTMGALAEHYELAALKSAGVGLFRIIRPLIVVVFFIGIGAFFFANNVWPVANLKFRTLLYSVTNQKPLLALDEGVFYNGIEGLSIRADRKNTETGELTDLLIYKYGKEKENKTVIRAKRGEMKKTADSRYLLMTLYDGEMYDEQKEKKLTKYQKRKDHPIKNAHIHSKFEKDVIRFDLSSLLFEETDEELFSKSYQMMTINQLTAAVDSIEKKKERKKEYYINFNHEKFRFSNDSIIGSRFDNDNFTPLSDDELKTLIAKEKNDQLIKQNRRKKKIKEKNKNKKDKNKDQPILKDSEVNKELDTIKNVPIRVTETNKKINSQKQNFIKADTIRIEKTEAVSDEYFWDRLTDKEKRRSINLSKTNITTTNHHIENIKDNTEYGHRHVKRYLIEYHRKFNLAFACIALFFIGAPLGAIIRKGGLGMPAVFAKMFFAIYYILNMIGEKMALIGNLEPWVGMWLSNAILFPIGIYLTYKAATDSALMDMEAYTKFFKKFKKKKENLHLEN